MNLNQKRLHLLYLFLAVASLGMMIVTIAFYAQTVCYPHVNDCITYDVTQNWQVLFWHPVLVFAPVSGGLWAMLILTHARWALGATVTLLVAVLIAAASVFLGSHGISSWSTMPEVTGPTFGMFLQAGVVFFGVFLMALLLHRVLRARAVPETA